MSKKYYIQILLFYFTFFIIGSTLFLFLFHTSLFANISVFFYRGIVLLLVASFLSLLTLTYFKKNKYGKFITFRDIILILTLIFCLNLVFFTLVPVTADRSISVFLLGYVNNHSQKSLSKDEITDAFIKKYLHENGAIQKRLSEQIISKNLLKEEERYRISDQGKLLIRFYDFISNLFGINKKNIAP